MENKKEMIEIDVRRMARALWRRGWIIVLVAVLFAAVAFSYAWFLVTPTYSASAQLYVNNTYGENTVGFSSSQIEAAQNLAATYMVILESREVLNDVVQMTGLTYSVDQLRAFISAAAVNETEVFQVTVTCTNYKHAAMIANAVADILPAKIAAVVDGSSVRVVDHAVENPDPVGPNYKRYGLIGALAGIVLSACVIIMLELMNTSINSEEYLIQAYSKYPLLALIPGDQNPRTGYYKGNYESEQRRRERRSGGAKK